VKQLGISRIEGDIVADASIFDEEAVSPYWLWEDMGNYYAAGVYGLAVFDNMFRLGLKSGLPGTKPEILYLKPALPEMRIINNLIAKDNAKDSAYFYGVPYRWERVLYGSLPAGREEFVIKGDIPDPPAYLAFRLQQELIKAGIDVQGRALSKQEPGSVCKEPGFFPKEYVNSVNNPQADHEAVVFYTGYSKPLGELVKIINYRSHNVCGIPAATFGAGCRSKGSGLCPGGTGVYSVLVGNKKAWISVPGNCTMLRVCLP
jgi:D-alanyl-D-alanine carboxypeptidase